MNFKVNVILILFPVFFIVFKPSLVFVDAALPNADLRVAISCLRKFFGEIRGKNFLNEDDSLSDGEYLGSFCSDASPESLDNKILEKAEGNNDGTGIRQCLERKGHGYVFNKYCEIESSNQNRQPVESPRILRKLPSGNLEFSDANSSAGLQQILQDVPSKNEELSNANTSIYKFINGVCESEEFTEFGKLIDEEDKKETLKCLEECAEKFIKRVANVLDSAKTQTIEMLEEKLSEMKNNVSLPHGISDEALQKMLAKEKDLKQKYTGTDQISTLKSKGTDVYSNALNTLKEKIVSPSDKNAKDIERIAILGKKYLYNYGDVYNNVDQCLTKEDKQLNNSAGNFDINLFSVFSIYTECAVRGCGMKPPSSVPLYELVEHGAKDPEPKPHTFLIENAKAVVQKLGFYKPRYTKFFKALWTGEKNIRGIDSNTKSPSNE